MLGAPLLFWSLWTNQWASFPVPFLSRFRQVEQDRRSAPAIARGGSSRSANDQKQRMPFSGNASIKSGNNRNQNTSSSNRNNQQPSGRGGRGGRRGGSAVGAVRKPRSSGRNNMMDIDQGPSGRPVGRFPRTTTDDSSKRGGRGGGRGGASTVRGRGGKRGGTRGGRGGKKAPLSRENLDADLDSYMMRDASTAKTTLDADLENYMLGVSDIPQQIGA